MLPSSAQSLVERSTLPLLVLLRWRCLAKSGSIATSVILPTRETASPRMLHSCRFPNDSCQQEPEHSSYQTPSRFDPPVDVCCEIFNTPFAQPLSYKLEFNPSMWMSSQRCPATAESGVAPWRGLPPPGSCHFRQTPFRTQIEGDEVKPRPEKQAIRRPS